MKIATKFNVDEKVYKLVSGVVKFKTPCPFCGGTKIVKDVKRRDWECVYCAGEGTLEIVDLGYKVDEKPYKISEINIQYIGGKSWQKIIRYEFYNEMVYTREEDLFYSIKEARNVAEKRNKEILAKHAEDFSPEEKIHRRRRM